MDKSEPTKPAPNSVMFFRSHDVLMTVSGQVQPPSGGLEKLTER